jgi:hypothetical protein
MAAGAAHGKATSGIRPNAAAFLEVEPPMHPRARTAAGRIAVAAPLVLFAGLASTCGYRAIAMPGRSFAGPLPPADANQKILAAELREHVEELAGAIGERRVGAGDGLGKARTFVERELRATGYEPRSDAFEAHGVAVSNVVAEVPGLSGALVVVGAHYDSADGAPGANDNASGVAVLLELARYFRVAEPTQTLRFVAFVNEEPPFFRSSEMGSRVSASRSKARGEIVTAMLSLETLGYYTDAEDSQDYPFPLGAAFPTRGNFVAFVGNDDSRELVRTCVDAFRRSVGFPSEGAALPESTLGVGWSDHESFWRIGVPALMVTDTAMLRYPHYHRASDTPDKLDYDRLARVTTGLVGVVQKLGHVH